MEGFILVGGKSSRMGIDKAGLMIGGRTMLERAADAMRSIAVDGIRLVGGKADPHYNFPVVADPALPIGGEDRSGPLLGVYAALAAARSEWIAVLACDLPFVSDELLRSLAGVDRDGVDAVVPMQSDGISQPLCALYRCDASLRAAEELINDGELSMRSLIAAIRTRSIHFDELKALHNWQDLFLNVNSPAEYAHAISVCET